MLFVLENEVKPQQLHFGKIEAIQAATVVEQQPNLNQNWTDSLKPAQHDQSYPQHFNSKPPWCVSFHWQSDHMQRSFHCNQTAHLHTV